MRYKYLMHPKCNSGELLGFSIHRAYAIEYEITITQQTKHWLWFLCRAFIRRQIR